MPSRSPWSLLLILVCAVVLPAGNVARAQSQTKLSVEVGWGGHLRAHRWTPVFVTASDPTPRNVVLEVHWPHAGNYGMQVHQGFAIGPTAATFPLLLPVRGYAYGYQEANYTLRDASTERPLAHFPAQPGVLTAGPQALDPAGILVGVSGRRSHLESLQGNTSEQFMSVAYLQPSYLPAAALGYDCLDLLVLNQPNLNTIGTASGGGDAPLDIMQQQAIVDWVRAGGNLIVWPGQSGFPTSSPLVDLLPAHLGDRINQDLSPQDRLDIGLGARFAHLAAYRLSAEAGAKPIELLGGKATAYTKRLGMGRMTVVPFDVAGLQFNSVQQGAALWKPILAAMSLHVPSAAPQQNYNTFWGLTTDDQRETQAAQRIAEALGDVPGAGQFGFFYVAIVLAGMMVVVGPVDWWVLKRLGRQPWTWVTTTGWIALVTCSAIALGSFAKSGDLHYRTCRVTYQVGNATVATNDTIGIYSPRTRDYALATAADSWWQPAGTADYGRGGMALDIDFHQTDQGNVPDPMRINVWSMRFLHGEQIGVAPPAIVASLSRTADANHVVGIIKNLTDRPLRNIRIRTSKGTGVCAIHLEAASTQPATQPASQPVDARADEVPPYATARIEAMVHPEPPPKQPEAQTPYYYYGQSVEAPRPGEMWSVAGELDLRRSRRMDELANSDNDLACIYADVVDPAPAVQLLDQQPIQQHWSFIRALVELGPQE